MFGLDASLRWFREELPVIKRAKFSFFGLLLLGFFVIGWTINSFYNFNLQAYRDRTENNERKIELLEERIQTDQKLIENLSSPNKIAQAFTIRSRIEELTKWLGKGQDLLQRNVSTDAEFTQWMYELGSWEATVSVLLQFWVSGVAYENFHVVSASGAWKGLNEKHSKERKFLNKRLEILTKHIEKFETELAGLD